EVYGRLIQFDQSLAMELGMASQTEENTALRLAPANPRVWLLRGIGAMFTPAEYGGGLAPAEERLTRAIELFEKDAPKPGEPKWGHAEAYGWLGQVYAKQGNKTKAMTAVNQAVELAPQSGF